MEIRLPRFKIERSEGGRFSLDKLSLPLLIGFGIHWTWVYLTMFSGRVIYFQHSADPTYTMSLFYVISLALLVITLFAYAIASFPFRHLFSSKRKRFLNRLAGTVMACGGTFLTCLADASTASGVVMIGISGVAAGVGSTVLLVSYGVSFGQSDLNATLATAALSLVFGAVLYTVVLEIAAFLPWLPFVVAVIIPAAECFCLWLNSSLLIDPLEFAQITLSVRKPTFALRVCLPFLLFGFALGILRTRALNDVPLFENPSVRILFVIGACVTGCVFVICAILTQKQNLNFLLRPLMPFAAVILAWYYFAGIASSLLQSVMFFAGYLVFECATWVYFSDVTQRYRISPFIVFGFGRGALAAGTLISVFISSPFGLNILDRRGVVILIFAALLIAYVLIPQDSTIRDLTIVDGSGHGLDNRGGGAEDNDKKTTHIGWFKYKCNALATRYLLSQRETEVLFLLAKGRNAAYIQERLYISEGTARTHMRHIYKKLNIHTQQELINMVDSMQVDLPPSAPLLP